MKSCVSLGGMLQWLFATLLFAGLPTGLFAGGVDNEIKPPKGEVLSGSYANADERVLAKVVKVVYKENFGKTGEGWHFSGNFQRGEDPIIGSVAESSEYADGTIDTLTSPAIALPSLGGNGERIVLRYSDRFELESHYDFGIVQVSPDGGQTWKELHRVSGRNNLGRAKIDLTAFAGKTINLRYVLSSDESNTYGGWKIGNMYLNIESPAYMGEGTSQNARSLTRASSRLGAVYTSLNAQHFPFIYSNIDVSWDDNATDALTQANFAVYENGVLQTDYFEVLPPQSGSGSRLADIVFIMDNSGSMSDKQNAVRNNVIAFVTSLQQSGIDFALGLCRFGQSAGSGNPIIEDNGVLTQDGEYFKNDVWGRNVDDGGREPGFRAIVESLSSFSFRPGAQKIIIWIGDEKPNQDSAFTEGQTQTALINASATLYALASSSYHADFQDMADATHGEVFNVTDPFDAILNDISVSVSSTYLVKYRSSNPVFDGIERNVTVQINYNGEQTEVYGSYIPGMSPVIQRTPGTIAYENQAWAAGNEFTIEAEVTDAVAPYTTGVTLYYKNVSQTSYTPVAMTNTSGNVWSANVPAGFAQAPGVAYYFTATDGDTTSALPSSSAQSNPFTIAILPNEAPTVSNIAANGSGVNRDINISADMDDTTNNVEEALLYYREYGALVYTQVVLAKDPSSSRYSGTVPGSAVTSNGIEYYLFAKDDFGVVTTYGMPDAPIFLSVAANISGIVVNSYSGTGLAGAVVKLFKTSDLSQILAQTQTDGSGEYSLSDLSPDDYAVEASMDGFITEQKTVHLSGSDRAVNFNLMPESAGKAYSIVLSWDAKPSDLDAMLSEPYESVLGLPNILSLCNYTWWMQQGSASTFPYATLDRNDIDGFGPETISVSQMVDGTYQYWVQQFSFDGSLETSNATVSVYRYGRLVKRYQVPETSTGKRYWHVFDFDSNGTIKDVNTLENSGIMSCSTGLLESAQSVDITPVVHYLLF